MKIETKFDIGDKCYITVSGEDNKPITTELTIIGIKISVEKHRPNHQTDYMCSTFYDCVDEQLKKFSKIYIPVPDDYWSISYHSTQIFKTKEESLANLERTKDDD